MHIGIVTSPADLRKPAAAAIVAQGRADRRRDGTVAVVKMPTAVLEAGPNVKEY